MSQKANIVPADRPGKRKLLEWIGEEGGINAVYRNRPVNGTPRVLELIRELKAEGLIDRQGENQSFRVTEEGRRYLEEEGVNRG